MNTLKKQIELVKFKDIIAFFKFLIAYPIALVIKCFHIMDKMWLICESEFEARDNGYWLYKYLKEQEPLMHVVYAIDKSSVDYKKVKKLGSVIQYGGFVHWIYYLCAEKNISTQKGGKPNAAVCYVLEVIFNMKNGRVFLQHGITVSDAEWLYYKNTKMQLFICGAKAEYDFVKNNFGYPLNNIVYTGFARFDQLHQKKTISGQILVMPSWREWIATPTSQSSKFDDISDFTKTEYFNNWNKFLNSKELHDILVEYNCKLLFYPHRNMQKYLKYFSSNSDRILMIDSQTYDIQQALIESELLITDYSSVFMDFAYMKKPVIFYQFDYDKFRKGQYKEGYFDYRNGLGECSQKLSDILKYIRNYCMFEFKLKDIYAEKINNFFVLNDTKNCSRIVQAIKNM